jgi:hypothetical protein
MLDLSTSGVRKALIDWGQKIMKGALGAAPPLNPRDAFVISS